MNNLQVKPESKTDQEYLISLNELRKNLNSIDAEFLSILSKRVNAVNDIENFKSENNVSAFEMKRLGEILKTRISNGEKLGLTKELVEEIYKALFKNSFQMQVEKQ